MSATLADVDVHFMGNELYAVDVPSDSNPHHTYEVLYDDSTGKCSCTCPSYQFGRGNPCKHITRSADAILYAVDRHVRTMDEPFTNGEVNTTNTASTFRGVVTRVGGGTSELFLDADNVDLFTSVLNNMGKGDALVVVRD